MRTYLSAIVLCLLACLSCQEKELPIPTKEDLSGTIWETNFDLETSLYGQIPVKMTICFDSDESMKVFLEAQQYRYKDLSASYTLNKNLLNYTVYFVDPNPLPARQEASWIIRKRTSKTMIWEPALQGVNFRSYIGAMKALLTTPITLYKKS